MTEIQRYLAEEIAEDHADGLRVAARGAAPAGVARAERRRAAASLLAAAVADQARAVARGAADRRPTRRQRCGGSCPPHTRDHVSRARRPEVDGSVGAARPSSWRRAGDPREPRAQRLDPLGCGRLAASGYSALAIDLLSEEGGTGSFADEFEAMAALGAAPPSRFVADMKAGVTELRRRLPEKNVAATGFCFGGGMTWLLLASKEPASPLRSRSTGRSREREPLRRQGRGARDLRGARLEGQRDSRGARAALQGRPATPSSRTPASTTRSSTRRARGTAA